MSNPNRRPCAHCNQRETSSSSGLCFDCRPCPHVELREGYVHIDGMPPMPTSTALQLAHRLADALAP